MEANKIKVTVALVCHQEKEELAYVLEDLKNQSSLDQIGEVLLFQNGNCEQTKKTAKSFLNQLPLKFFHSSENNLGQARAELVKASQYELIAWTDSDCRLPKNWLEQLLLQWENKTNKNAVAIGGPNRLPENKFWQKMFKLSLSHPLGHGWSPQAWIVKKPTAVSHIPTTNGLFLKQAILKAENFSKQCKLIGEDLELGERLKKQGKLILFPKPLVINNYANSYFENLKRLLNFGAVPYRPITHLFILSLAFTPLFISCLFLSFFKKQFLLFPLSYIFMLCFASLLLFLKKRQKNTLLLPFFWFIQHLFYSTGSVLGFYKRIRGMF